MINLFTNLSNWKLKYLCALIVLLCLGVGNVWATTLATWSSASRTADTQYSPTSYSTNNSGAKLKSECTLNTAGAGGSAGTYYGTWTNKKCIYITGLNLSGYSGINMDISLRRRNATCTAAFYVSTDGSTYAAKALDTKTLTNTSTVYNITGIGSDVKAIKIYIDGGSGNLWLGAVTIKAPDISVTSSLSSFSYTEGSGPSAYQSFTVSGSDLTNNITVSATSDYEVSTSSGSSYASSKTLTQTSGTVSSTTIYVHLKSGLSAGTHNGTITISSSPASNKTISLTGSVAAAASCTANPSIGAASLNGSFF